MRSLGRKGRKDIRAAAVKAINQRLFFFFKDERDLSMLNSARKEPAETHRDKGGNGGLNLAIICPFKKYYQAPTLCQAL